MEYSNLQYDIRSSLLKMCKDFVFDNHDGEFEIFDFDAHSGLNDLPNANLIGVGEYSLMEDVDNYLGNCMIIISTTQDDSNLLKLYPVVSQMMDRCKANKEISVVESHTGNVIGNLKLKEGTEAMSVARTESRPFQAINISFGFGFIQTP